MRGYVNGDSALKPITELLTLLKSCTKAISCQIPIVQAALYYHKPVTNLLLVRMKMLLWNIWRAKKSLYSYSDAVFRLAGYFYDQNMVAIMFIL